MKRYTLLQRIRRRLRLEVIRMDRFRRDNWENMQW
jgi:hypothetical protein